jgi:arylsulfatase A-like enzyme
VWVSFPDPHHPFCPPHPYGKQYDPSSLPLPVRREGEYDLLPPHFRSTYEGTLAALPYAGGRLSGTHPAGYRAVTPAHAREMRAHYYGMVSLIDDAVGRLLAALDRLGLAEDTVVVFATDHGELLGDHGLWLKGPFHYEALTRAPLLWRWPRGLTWKRTRTSCTTAGLTPLASRCGQRCSAG